MHYILCVTNDLTHDQRVHKVANSLLGQGHKITLVGRHLPGQAPVQRPYATRRFRLPFRRGAAFYAAYNFRLWVFLMCRPYHALIANDLDTLPAARLAAWLRRKTLFFDAHEYFTQVPELVGRPRVQRIWKSLETLCLKGVRTMYTVSPPIRELYAARYPNMRVGLVRNLPLRKALPNLQEMQAAQMWFAGFAPNSFIIYQGALNKARGLRLLLQALQWDNTLKLLLAGHGDEREALMQYAKRIGVARRTIFTGPVPFAQLHAITAQAAVGVSLEEDMGLNYRYALPNKLFDYIQAEIPVLVSDLPAMSGIVGQYGVGEVLAQRTPENLAAQLQSLIHRKSDDKALQQSLAKAAEILVWEEEEQVLFDLFGENLNKKL